MGAREIEAAMQETPVPAGDHKAQLRARVEARLATKSVRLLLLCQKKGSPRPVRWPPGGRCSSVHRWHTGQRGSLATRALVSRTRSVAIEVGLCRSGRSGGSAGFLTLG